MGPTAYYVSSERHRQCGVNEPAQRPKFRSGDTRWDSNARPLDPQSRALTTEIQRGKLRCRGRLRSFIPNPFICFECFSNIERKNKEIISERNQEQQRQIPENPSRAKPMSGLLTTTCVDWPTGTESCARVACHLVKNRLELPKLSAKERLSMWVP